MEKRKLGASFHRTWSSDKLHKKSINFIFVSPMRARYVGNKSNNTIVYHSKYAVISCRMNAYVLVKPQDYKILQNIRYTFSYSFELLIIYNNLSWNKYNSHFQQQPFYWNAYFPNGLELSPLLYRNLSNSKSHFRRQIREQL